MNDERLMSVKEVAEYIGVHPNTVKRISDRGEMPYYVINNRGDRRFRRSEVDAWVLEGRAGRDGRRRPAAGTGAQS